MVDKLAGKIEKSFCNFIFSCHLLLMCVSCYLLVWCVWLCSIGYWKCMNRSKWLTPWTDLTKRIPKYQWKLFLIFFYFFIFLSSSLFHKVNRNRRILWRALDTFPNHSILNDTHFFSSFFSSFFSVIRINFLIYLLTFRSLCSPHLFVLVFAREHIYINGIMFDLHPVV